MDSVRPAPGAPRIALIHALRDSVDPIIGAFARQWPEAQTFNLLDDSLSATVAMAGRITTPIVNRFLTLGRYAASAEVGGHAADAILFTCSAFGPAIEAVQADQVIPVLKPNEAAFAAALERGRRIGLLVTFAPSLDPLAAELRAMAAQRGRTCDVQAVVVEGALRALQCGRGDEHDAAIAAAAAALDDRDVVVLGQFSMARARQGIPAALQARVLTTPDCAVDQLRRQLTAG